MCCTLDVLSLPRPTFPEPRSIFRSFTKCTQITCAPVILHVNQARCITSLHLRNAKTLVLMHLVRSWTLETRVNNPNGGPVVVCTQTTDKSRTSLVKDGLSNFSLSGRPLPSERTENEHLEQKPFSLSSTHLPSTHPSNPLITTDFQERRPRNRWPKGFTSAWPPFDCALPQMPHDSCLNMQAVWHVKRFEPKRKLLSDNENQSGANSVQWFYLYWYFNVPKFHIKSKFSNFFSRDDTKIIQIRHEKMTSVGIQMHLS